MEACDLARDNSRVEGGSRLEKRNIIVLLSLRLPLIAVPISGQLRAKEREAFNGLAWSN